MGGRSDATGAIYPRFIDTTLSYLEFYVKQIQSTPSNDAYDKFLETVFVLLSLFSLKPTYVLMDENVN